MCNIRKSHFIFPVNKTGTQHDSLEYSFDYITSWLNILIRLNILLCKFNENYESSFECKED